MPVDDARAVIVPEAPDGVRVQESGDEGVLREDPALEETADAPFEPAVERRGESALLAVENSRRHDAAEGAHQVALPPAPRHFR